VTESSSSSRLSSSSLFGARQAQSLSDSRTCLAARRFSLRARSL